jgi:hypothetical protein
VHLVYRPTVEELAAAGREQLRLRGLLGRLRAVGAAMLVAGPLGLVLGQWLFTLYAVGIGAVLVVSPTPVALRRAARRTPMLHFDTTADVAEEGMTIVVPTASSRVAWAHYSGWSLLPEGLLLMHALQPRLFWFVPRSALTPEVLEVITRNVPRHPRARGEVTAVRPSPGA